MYPYDKKIALSGFDRQSAQWSRTRWNSARGKKIVLFPFHSDVCPKEQWTFFRTCSRFRNGTMGLKMTVDYFLKVLFRMHLSRSDSTAYLHNIARWNSSSTPYCTGGHQLPHNRLLTQLKLQKFKSKSVATFQKNHWGSALVSKFEQRHWLMSHYPK